MAALREPLVQHPRLGSAVFVGGTNCISFPTFSFQELDQKPEPLGQTQAPMNGGESASVSEGLYLEEALAWSGLPVTERTSDASPELDMVSPTGFLRVCRHSDAQLFSGWRHGRSVYDLLPSLTQLVRASIPAP